MWRRTGDSKSRTDLDIAFLLVMKDNPTHSELSDKFKEPLERQWEHKVRSKSTTTVAHKFAEINKSYIQLNLFNPILQNSSTGQLEVEV